MQKSKKKVIIRIVIICVSAITLGLLLFGSFKLGRFSRQLEYRMNDEKMPVFAQKSSWQNYELIIYQVGEPDFPFGSTHCRYELYSVRKLVNELNFNVSNDGQIVDDGNFEVKWEPNAVVIKVTAEEQQDFYYRLYGDGRRDVWSEEQEDPGNPIADQVETKDGEETRSENVRGNSEYLDEEKWAWIYGLDVTADYTDIRDLATNYDKDQAQADGCFVVGAMVHNESKYAEFKEKYSNDEEAFIRIVQNTVEGDPIIIDIYYRPGSKEGMDAVYPPSIFVIKDDTRDNFAAPENRNITCEEYDGITEYKKDECSYWVAYRGKKEDIDLDSRDTLVIFSY